MNGKEHATNGNERSTGAAYSPFTLKILPNVLDAKTMHRMKFHLHRFARRSLSLRDAQCSGQRGFTLIELMITVAVVGILAAIAYPSYTTYIRKSKRATAQAALVDIASKEQAYQLDRRAYTNALADIGFGTPREVSNAYTFIVVSDNTASPMSFVATATPIPGTGQAAQGEQTLSVDQSGARTPAMTPGYWGN